MCTVSAQQHMELTIMLIQGSRNVQGLQEGGQFHVLRLSRRPLLQSGVPGMTKHISSRQITLNLKSFSAEKLGRALKVLCAAKIAWNGVRLLMCCKFNESRGILGQ